nr:hypothetical protein [Tanacetum cinerariifolium]
MSPADLCSIKAQVGPTTSNHSSAAAFFAGGPPQGRGPGGAAGGRGRAVQPRRPGAQPALSAAHHILRHLLPPANAARVQHRNSAAAQDGGPLPEPV